MTTMPRVVPDQRSKFENDELFRKLGRDSEIRYTGYRDRAQEERQMRFVNSCREGHAQLSFVATGTNLHLQFYPNSWSETTDRKPTKEYVDFDKEIGKVSKTSKQGVSRYRDIEIQRTLTSVLAGSQPAGIRRKPCKIACYTMTESLRPSAPADQYQTLSTW
nr:core-binding factor subunit beta-like [Lytechinus pictus]